MSALSVYSLLEQHLQQHLDPKMNAWSQRRLVWLVMGIVAAKSVSPARIARALFLLGISQASAESLERRVRRLQNDEQITAAVCLHPFAKRHLAFAPGAGCHLPRRARGNAHGRRLVSRTRLAPLLGNLARTAAARRQRVQFLLDTVAPLLPLRVPVIWLADRAFGTPQWTDRLQRVGWRFVVRVQQQTRCRDTRGREQSVGSWLCHPAQRRKGRYALFKKAGWRSLSLVGHWGTGHRSPLCVVSDLPPGWYLLALYRRRYAIEGMFRDLKSAGWQWEQGQVSDLGHLARLLAGMALATWIALLSGTLVARDLLAQKASGQRRTRPWWGKYSLFTLGLDCLHRWLYQAPRTVPEWRLSDWEAPHWQAQCTAHQVRAYIFNITYQPVRP